MSNIRPAVLLLGDTLNIGGTERQFIEVACGLPTERWSVSVSCLRADGPLRSRLDTANITPWSSGPGSLRSPRIVPAIVRLAREMRKRQIRVFHSFDFYSNIFGLPAARLARVPAIIASQRDLGDLRPHLQQCVRALMLRLADRIIVNSPAISERLGPSLQSRVTLVPNGLALESFTPANRKRSAAEKTFAIGTLANLRPEKGLSTLLRAVAQVRDQHPAITLSVWGDGPERPRLERLITELKLNPVALLPGRTDNAPRALASLDAFVLPSTSEAGSNALLEAMATGLPVIATSVGGNRIAIEDGISGLLVPPGDVDALTAALLRIARDPAAAAPLGAAARAHVEADYSMPKMIERMESVYCGILKSKGHPCPPEVLRIP